MISFNKQLYTNCYIFSNIGSKIFYYNLLSNKTTEINKNDFLGVIKKIDNCCIFYNEKNLDASVLQGEKNNIFIPCSILKLELNLIINALREEINVEIRNSILKDLAQINLEKFSEVSKFNVPKFVNTQYQFNRQSSSIFLNLVEHLQSIYELPTQQICTDGAEKDYISDKLLNGIVFNETNLVHIKHFLWGWEGELSLKSYDFNSENFTEIDLFNKQPLTFSLFKNILEYPGLSKYTFEIEKVDIYEIEEIEVFQEAEIESLKNKHPFIQYLFFLNRIFTLELNRMQINVLYGKILGSILTPFLDKKILGCNLSSNMIYME